MKVDAKLVLSVLSLVVGILWYILWGITYGVWVDIGIYAPSVIFSALGIVGIIWYLDEIKEKK
ncbi:MAG: hypothetical protein J7K61_04510 [Thermoplasmata archaeon]|nr:hypothetical protein [Thermoplasmata archaeon]